MKGKELTVKERYQALSDVLDQAYIRASEGKGKERHDDGKSFSEQDICSEMRFLEIGPAIYQVRKKAKESLRLNKQAAINEFLDVIVYSAAAIIILQESEG